MYHEYRYRLNIVGDAAWVLCIDTKQAKETRLGQCIVYRVYLVIYLN